MIRDYERRRDPTGALSLSTARCCARCPLSPEADGDEITSKATGTPPRGRPSTTMSWPRSDSNRSASWRSASTRSSNGLLSSRNEASRWAGCGHSRRDQGPAGSRGRGRRAGRLRREAARRSQHRRGTHGVRPGDRRPPTLMRCPAASSDIPPGQRRPDRKGGRLALRTPYLILCGRTRSTTESAADVTFERSREDFRPLAARLAGVRSFRYRGNSVVCPEVRCWCKAKPP